jgi:hypothetical protein
MENTLPEAVTFTVEADPKEKESLKSDFRTFTIPRLTLSRILSATVFFPGTSEETEQKRIDRELNLIAVASADSYKGTPETYKYLRRKLLHDPEKISKLASIAMQMCDIPDMIDSFRVLNLNKRIYG